LVSGGDAGSPFKKEPVERETVKNALVRGKFFKRSR